MAGKTDSVSSDPDAMTSSTFGAEAVALTQARLGGLDPLSAQAGVLLSRVAISHVHVSEQSVHRSGIGSWSSFRVLWMVWLFGEVQARDLARLSGISRQATSTVLSTLESKGFVVRNRTSTTDRRLIAVTVTDEGARLVEESFLAQNRVDAAFFDVLSAQERRQFVGLLTRILHAADDAARDG
ncbi:MarR family winged helix-turn-helix transcriptional regulator [Gordonia hydrophobica]|uniref:MarR family transcriptional regulator n=1 Tax=Gordonia hydrophobica TaxID=40516 RepID=A0ABZ2U6P5_9ACTN|nr:MarR family transcriptional regulator [Gordonia hydrophobica]MBM7368343.1 DNA-binding MarR family transcriptional regulator [Gordonia hydrophobica]